tara:strand:- start:159754 stop:160647 length:894 start_codon:yes stop_codon:yes gene_type:complete
MTKEKDRFSDSIAARFANSESAECLILKSESDVGVRRNLGRNGARFAPKAIENTFKKLNHHLDVKSFLSKTVAYQNEELADYDQAIQKSSDRIKEALSYGQNKKLIHLGGGHDHAYPLLKALDSNNILIINFDAHCDTRIDNIKHSGTPFRNFDEESKNKFHLVQVGIHDYANNKATLSELKNNSEKIIYTEELTKLKSPLDLVDQIFESCPFEINKDTKLFISIDSDAISSSVMEAVSAVNHDGIDPKELLAWVEALKDFPCETKVLGIYEYNPIFENLSQKGARYLAGLIYKFLG